MLLSPLKDLSLIQHPDVRQKQLEYALHILNNGGDTLGSGWPVILQVIGDGSNIQSLVNTRYTQYGNFSLLYRNDIQAA